MRAPAIASSHGGAFGMMWGAIFYHIAGDIALLSTAAVALFVGIATFYAEIGGEES